MADKAKLSHDEFIVEQSTSNVKPSSYHIEDTSQDVKIPRVPYWDTEYVVGANRNLPGGESSSVSEKNAVRPGFIKRRWLHLKRHWKLYTVILVVLLAIGLPVLYESLDRPRALS